MTLQGKTIALTGATGFLGTYIALELLQQGATVRGVVRSPEKGAWLAEKGVQLHKADLLEPTALARAFEGVDAVISNAALLTLKRASWEEFYRHNRTGTENVFHAAHRAGVSRLVQVSTVAVYNQRLPRNLPESTPRLTEKDRKLHWAYAVTKSLSEQLAWDLAEEFSQDLTVVRPGPVYGQGDQNIKATLNKLFRAPLLPVPSLGFPAVHAGDVAHGICAALSRPASVGRAYNLAGPPAPLTQLFEIWKKHSGKRPLLLPLPLPLQISYDISAAEKDLGFRNRSLAEGVEETFSGSIPR